MRLPRAVQVAMLALLAAPSRYLLAQESEPPQGAKVHMHAAEGGYAADGYLFEPAGRAPFAAVLLIPDRAGVSGFIRNAAQALAASGYLAVAIDLYRGQSPESGEPAAANVMHDLGAARQFLRTSSVVRHDDVAVAAWGSGADYALRWSEASELRAIALWLPDAPPPSALANVHTAVLANIGGMPSRPLETLAHHSAARVERIELHFYGATPGRFYDPADTQHYREAAAAEALAFSQAFFAKTLR